MAGRHASRAVRSPREHGFWVMLAVTVVAGVLAHPSVSALVAAGLACAGSFAGAVLIGRRIRKNPGLQLAASASFAVAAGVIALVGGAGRGHAIVLSLGLGSAFVAGAACVRAILERQRRHPRAARVWAASSILVPMGVSGLLWSAWGWYPALAPAITTAYALLLVALAPDARSLKRVGQSLGVVHLACALVLVS